MVCNAVIEQSKIEKIYCVCIRNWRKIAAIQSLQASLTDDTTTTKRTTINIK